jgi:hypothetical protein
MTRLLLAAALLVSAGAGALSACDADVREGCIAGPCTGGSGGSAASSSGSTGTGGGSGGAGAAAACPETPRTGDFPCDVFAIIHAKCNPCHQMPPLNGAPFPELTYADTQKVYAQGPPERLIFQQMYLQIQPGASPQMPLIGTLTAAEFAKLSGWLAECAPPVPAGTGCGCPGNGCN